MDCDIAGVIKPSTATLASFCLASKRGTSIVIRVQSIDVIASGTTIKISLDDITLPTSASIFYFGFELNFITNSGTTTASYVKARRIFSNVFSLTGTVSVTPNTSGSFPATSTTYGETGISMQYTANFTNPLL